MLHEHKFSWNSEVLQNAVARVVSIITHLLADNSQFNTWERHVIFVSQLSHENLDTFLLSVNDELSIYGTVSSHFAESSWPPFNRLKSWSIEDKLLGLFIIFSNGLETSDIASMT